MTQLYTTTISSPVGDLVLLGHDDHLTGLHMMAAAQKPVPEWAEARHDPHALASVSEQLAQYFAGERRTFDLPLAPRGTPFQMSVWSALGTIGYGQTRTYGQVAAQVGNPKASRAVGMANNRNPIAIIVPCHRVIGATGNLTGYGGGLDNKKLLLDLEAANEKIPDPTAMPDRQP
ncbi:MAG: methylated-DNA--[protein]-cysteine S-methyltransferase [Acidimicrobiales bacterium]